MPAPAELNWLINPDVVTAAIQTLVKVVGVAMSFLSASLIGTLLYIWNEHKKAMQTMSADVKTEIKQISKDFKDDIGRVAHSLETISGTLFDRQRSIEIRVEAHESRCEERNRMRRCSDQEER